MSFSVFTLNFLSLLPRLVLCAGTMPPAALWDDRCQRVCANEFGWAESALELNEPSSTNPGGAAIPSCRTNRASSSSSLRIWFQRLHDRDANNDIIDGVQRRSNASLSLPVLLRVRTPPLRRAARTTRLMSTRRTCTTRTAASAADSSRRRGVGACARGLLLKQEVKHEPTPSASVSPSEASPTPQQPQQQQQQQQQQSTADAMKAHAEEVNRLFAERFLPKPLPQPPPTPTSGTPDDGTALATGGPALRSSRGPGPTADLLEGTGHHVRCRRLPLLRVIRSRSNSALGMLMLHI